MSIETPDIATPKPGRGAPARNKNAKKSGRYALEASLRRGGFGVLTRNQRETVAEWRASIEADLGGVDQLSQLKRLQLERFLVTEVLLQSIDAWLLQQPSVINRRKKSAYPIVAERSRLAQLSLQLSSALGLERKQRDVPTLAEYLRSREKGDSHDNSNPNE